METKKVTIPTYFGKCLGMAAEKPALCVQSSFYKKEQNSALEEKVLEYAKNHLPQEGILKVNCDGLVYVDLSERYIHELYPLLEKSTLLPPPYFDTEDSIGAHITAILSEENETGIPIEELHQVIPFTITGCYSVEPMNWEEMKRVFFLTIEAPAIEALRTKLSLPPTIHQQMFHITFAVEKRFLSLSDILEQRNEELFILSLKNRSH